ALLSDQRVDVLVLSEVLDFTSLLILIGSFVQNMSVLISLVEVYSLLCSLIFTKISYHIKISYYDINQCQISF
ncbi:hypothetical protein Drorol1_Dr00020843, partial [Drosera rotundifolia]